MKFIVKLTLLTLLVLGIAACEKKSTSLSLGAIIANGPGIDGSVPAGTERVYTLLNINANHNYTLRTEIPTLGTDTTPDGTLTVSIYESEAAFKSDPTTSVTTLAPLAPQTNFPYVYEANFQAPSSGNYVAVISGTSITNSTTQFFYDLRLMSADPSGIISFATTSVSAFQTVAINPGYLQVYNGGQISSSGTYSINLKTTVTSTLAYPQLFVYRDSKLKTESLLYSSVTNSMNFIVTDFNFTTSPTSTTRPPDPNNSLASGVTITGVQFTSGTGTTTPPGSPFIVVKGTSAVTYILTVEQ